MEKVKISKSYNLENESFIINYEGITEINNNDLILIESHSYYLTNMAVSGNIKYVDFTFSNKSINNLKGWTIHVSSVTPTSANGHITPWAENVTASGCKLCCTSSNISQAIITIVYIGTK